MVFKRNIAAARKRYRKVARLAHSALSLLLDSYCSLAAAQGNLGGGA